MDFACPSQIQPAIPTQTAWCFISHATRTASHRSGSFSKQLTWRQRFPHGRTMSSWRVSPSCVLTNPIRRALAPTCSVRHVPQLLRVLRGASVVADFVSPFCNLRCGAGVVRGTDVREQSQWQTDGENCRRGQQHEFPVAFELQVHEKHHDANALVTATAMTRTIVTGLLKCMTSKITDNAVQTHRTRKWPDN